MDVYPVLLGFHRNLNMSACVCSFWRQKSGVRRRWKEGGGRSRDPSAISRVLVQGWRQSWERLLPSTIEFPQHCYVGSEPPQPTAHDALILGPIAL